MYVLIQYVRNFCPLLIECGFSRQRFMKVNIKSMKILSVGAELKYANGQMDGHEEVIT
jgi:hypothetical protein